MAEVTKGTSPSPSTLVPGHDKMICGLLAGEAIAAGDLVYIKSSDGKVWKATGAAANEAARVEGMAPESASAGEAVSIYRNMEFGYKPLVGGNPVAVGATLFLSGTVPGGLADAASTGDAVGVATVIDADGRIRVGHKRVA